MVHFGLILVHFGPFRSANRTLATPDFISPECSFLFFCDAMFVSVEDVGLKANFQWGSRISTLSALAIARAECLSHHHQERGRWCMRERFASEKGT